jgi:hypothetical protein
MKHKPKKKRYSHFVIGELVSYARNGDACYECTCDCGNTGPIPFRWLEGKFIEQCEECEEDRLVAAIKMGGNGVRRYKK